MKSYRIVVGVDYSDNGKRALQQAIQVSSLHVDAEVHVLHVDAKGTKVEGQADSSDLAHSDAALDKLETFAQGQLDSYRKEHGDPDVKRLSTHFRFGAPAEELVQLAVDLNADLLVVGTHGRTGLKRIVLGSVAESCVRTAPCPVLVARAKEHREMSQVSDEIEPLCEACEQIRAQTDGEQLWCKRHAEPRHIRTHRYTYGYGAAGATQSTRLGAGRSD